MKNIRTYNPLNQGVFILLSLTMAFGCSAAPYADLMAFYPNVDQCKDRYPQITVKSGKLMYIAFLRDRVDSPSQELAVVEFDGVDYAKGIPFQLTRFVYLIEREAAPLGDWILKNTLLKENKLYVGYHSWDVLTPDRLVFTNRGQIMCVERINPRTGEASEPITLFPPPGLKEKADENLMPTISSGGEVVFLSSLTKGDLYSFNLAKTLKNLGKLKRASTEADIRPFVRRLTENPEFDSQPTWSPDGSRIAYLTTNTGSAELRLMNFKDGSTSTLVPDELSCANPAWASDGSMIAFYSIRAERSATGKAEKFYDLYTVFPEGGKPRLIASDVQPNDMFGPAFIGKNQQLVYKDAKSGSIILYDLVKSTSVVFQPVDESKQPVRSPCDIASLAGQNIFTLASLNSEGLHRIYIYKIQEQ